MEIATHLSPLECDIRGGQLLTGDMYGIVPPDVHDCNVSVEVLHASSPEAFQQTLVSSPFVVLALRVSGFSPALGHYSTERRS